LLKALRNKIPIASLAIDDPSKPILGEEEIKKAKDYDLSVIGVLPYFFSL
jgi:hypothetical protein